MNLNLKTLLLHALFLIIIALGLSRCQKTDNCLNSDYNQLSNQFFNSTTADPEVQKLATNIKRQDSVFKFLPEFIKKNGTPIWNKTVYYLKNQTGKFKKGARDYSSPEGFFLVPLQANGSSAVQSYIAAYKHNDSLYTYRLYNRDSLNAIHPDSSSGRNALRNAQAVFAYFESSINNKDSIHISAPEGATIKNASLNFNSSSNSERKSNFSRLADLTCVFTMVLTVEYTYIPDSAYTYGGWTVDVSLEITIDCTGTGGGDCGCNYTDPYSGSPDPYSGSGGDWWMYGSGWPWDNPSGTPYYYFYDPNTDPWYPFWTGGGISNNYEEVGDPAILGNFFDDPNYFEDDNSPITFDVTQQQWPKIENVLSVSDFVPYDKRNCLTLAQEQIGKANVKDLGYGSAFKIYDETNGTNSGEAKNGVNYIISKLQTGKPVIVGVDREPGTPSIQNGDKSTDHFIVITGAGTDSQGNYFTFFDNATNWASHGASSNNKLYYYPNSGIITGHSDVPGANSPSPRHNYIVTQVRKNK